MAARPRVARLASSTRQRRRVRPWHSRGGRPVGVRGLGILLASRCWALLLARIYECLPLQCPHCGEPLRIIAFVTDPEVVGQILRHVGEPTEAPQVLPARSPPQPGPLPGYSPTRSDSREMA